MLGNFQNYKNNSLRFQFKPDAEAILKKPFNTLTGSEKKKFIDAFISIPETEDIKRWQHLAGQTWENLMCCKKYCEGLSCFVPINYRRDLQQAINHSARQILQSDFARLSTEQQEHFLYAYRNITAPNRWQYLVWQNTEGLQKIITYLNVQLNSVKNNRTESKQIKKNIQELIEEVDKAVARDATLVQDYALNSPEAKEHFIEMYRITTQETRKAKLFHQSDESLRTLVKDLQSKADLPLYAVLIPEVEEISSQMSFQKLRI